MSTNQNDGDLLRNPAVDFDRTDLSARGILLFLAGLLVAGIFIELVLWGMFRFLSHSTLFVQGNTSPLIQTQRAMPETNSILQNTGQVNTNVFPEPRLQTNDVYDMDSFVQREHEILYPKQPFEDSTGTVHIPINQAMALIVERGLPVKPSAPPRDFSAPTAAGGTVGAQSQGMMNNASQAAKPGPDQKQ